VNEWCWRPKRKSAQKKLGGVKSLSDLHRFGVAGRRGRYAPGGWGSSKGTDVISQGAASGSIQGTPSEKAGKKKTPNLVQKVTCKTGVDLTGRAHNTSPKPRRATPGQWERGGGGERIKWPAMKRAGKTLRGTKKNSRNPRRRVGRQKQRNKETRKKSVAQP